MFAIIAAVFFFLFAFNVKLGTIKLIWIGVGFLAVHLGYNIALPAFTNRNRTAA